MMMPDTSYGKTQEVLVMTIAYKKTDVSIANMEHAALNTWASCHTPYMQKSYDWKDGEQIMDRFKEHNMLHRDSSLRVQYKYGPLTTKS